MLFLETQVVYIEYSGTAANRVTGSVSNLAAVNQGVCIK
jgi:heptaprenylglyceryl phosphate synthase